MSSWAFPSDKESIAHFLVLRNKFFYLIPINFSHALQLTPVDAGKEPGRAGKESLFWPPATTATPYRHRAVCWMAERCVAHLFEIKHFFELPHLFVINRYLPTSLS